MNTPHYYSKMFLSIVELVLYFYVWVSYGWSRRGWNGHVLVRHGGNHMTTLDADELDSGGLGVDGMLMSWANTLVYFKMG